MPDCVFCGIAAGTVPATVVAETDRVLALRNISPSAPIHVLVIPRDHHSDIAALSMADPTLAAELLTMAAQVATAEQIGAGWRLVFNTGADAGQTIFHAHGHVLGGRVLLSLG